MRLRIAVTIVGLTLVASFGTFVADAEIISAWESERGMRHSQCPDSDSESPNGGFPGNPLTPEEQSAKLRAVAEVARRVW